MAIVITSFSPSGGPTTGGTKVAIVGTGLDTVDDVLFGGVPAQIDLTAANSPTLLTVIAPPIPNDGTLVVKIGLIDNAGSGVIAESSGSYTYTTVASPVLGTTVNSKWKLDVDTSGVLDGSSYKPVRGMTNFTPGQDYVTQDDSDFDSGGDGSDVVTQIKWSLTGTVDRKVAAGNVEDPGQAFLRVTAGGVGQANVARFRWYDRNGTPGEAYEGYGLVKWSEKGGSNSDKSSVDFTVMGRGPRANITNPA